jgi:hypothetical protein
MLIVGALIGPDSGRPVTLRAILPKSVLVENAIGLSRLALIFRALLHEPRA